VRELLCVSARALALWKDPVGSNIIAGVIVAGVGYAFVWLVAAASPSSLVAHPIVKLGVPASALMLMLLLWHRLRRTRKTLVFLSAGGTCRAPMAKAIVTQLLETKKPRPRIDIRAAGLGPISGTEASYAARYAIREMYGNDLLKDHRPELLSSDLATKADLILAMDKSLLLTPGKTLPPNKAFLLKEFLGLQGDVVDPWPDGKDTATLERYRACAEELRTILTAHIDRILKVLDL
jgi:protein-tyrosine-phosphatase